MEVKIFEYTYLFIGFTFDKTPFQVLIVCCLSRLIILLFLFFLFFQLSIHSDNATFVVTLICFLTYILYNSRLLFVTIERFSNKNCQNHRRPITADASSARSQSEFKAWAITCSRHQARENERVQVGFNFASHRLRKWPITERYECNRGTMPPQQRITFDTQLKTALL